VDGSWELSGFEALPPDEMMDALAATLAGRGRAVVLTGSGVSAASGIPTFRGDDGLWTRYDPMEYGTIHAFRRDPERVWEMLWELDRVLDRADPNPAHHALAALEHEGAIDAVVTQNVDGLHQAAGSRTVVELHGSRLRLRCLTCGAERSRDEVVTELEPDEVPRCSRCGEVLKPDVVLFGEDLPHGAMTRAEELIGDCDDLVIVGTSAEVEPAAGLPRLARARGAHVWEIDPEPEQPTDRRIALPAEEALPTVLERVRRRTRAGAFDWLRQLLR
jgi:NAD-dependent deacetylase